MAAPTTIIDLMRSAQAAVAHAKRPGRLQRCRQRQAHWAEVRAGYQRKRISNHDWPSRFTPELARLARLAVIAEMRSLAWAKVAEGDAAGAWDAWLTASRLDRQQRQSIRA